MCESYRTTPSDAGLCYPRCRSGYYGVGPVCWQKCDGIDRGALCETQSLEIKAKHTYTRTAGVIKSKCKDGEENDAGLCYPDCKDGYNGVGPVCWRKNFGKSLELAFSSFFVMGPNIATCISNGAILSWARYGTATRFTQQDFSFMKYCLWPIISIARGIDDTWDPNKVAIGFEIHPVSIALFAGISYYSALAFTFPPGGDLEIYAYTGYCIFGKIDISVGQSISMVLYRSIDDIPGKVSYFSVGVDIGNVFSVDQGYAFNSECEITAMSFDIGVEAGISPIDIQGGICNTVHMEPIDNNNGGRRLIESPTFEIDESIKEQRIKIAQQQLLENEQCFDKLTSKYYARCHQVIKLNNIDNMEEIQTMCLRIADCIGYTYDVQKNKGIILSLLECSINGIKYFESEDNKYEEFYINNCFEEQQKQYCDDNGFCELVKKQYKSRNNKMKQYYAKCPFDIEMEVNLQENQASNTSDWINIFQFDVNGDIAYPAISKNNNNEYKLEIGNKYQCISSSSITPTENDKFKISVKCNGESKLYLNEQLLCSTDTYNIFDIAEYDGNVISYTQETESNDDIYSVKTTSAAYPWIGFDDNDNDNIIFKTISATQYIIHENRLIAPYLKFEGNYLIQTDIFLKFDDDLILNETELTYNILEIGFDDDLDITTNDILLNFHDDQVFGLMLAISTSDETVKFCYENNEYFMKNEWNEINIYIEYNKATLYVNGEEGCFIDLSLSPINTHQQMVPLTFASTRFNKYVNLNGLFRNIQISNNV